MLKKHMAACLVATLFAAPAFAQTSGAPSGATTRPMTTGSGSTTAGSPAMANPSTGSDTNASGPALNSTGAASSSMNSASSGSQSSSTMAQAGANNGQFMTQMQPNQMMASDLIGTKVISANNESIGDINDVIVDRNGQAVAAVVGVGGFLGIGEKNVAVPFNALQFASRAQVNAMNNAAKNANAANAGNSGTMTNSGNNVSATGSTAMNNNNVNATGSTNTSSGAAANASSNEPERVILNMTKAELQAAPKFNKSGSNTATGSASPNQ